MTDIFFQIPCHYTLHFSFFPYCTSDANLAANMCTVAVHFTQCTRNFFFGTSVSIPFRSRRNPFVIQTPFLGYNKWILNRMTADKNSKMECTQKMHQPFVYRMGTECNGQWAKKIQSHFRNAINFQCVWAGLVICVRILLAPLWVWPLFILPCHGISFKNFIMSI